MKKCNPEKVAVMYTALIKDGSIIYAGKPIEEKQKFIKIMGKKVGRRNLQEIITQCEMEIQKKLKKKLNYLQIQTNKIQIQLDNMK